MSVGRRPLAIILPVTEIGKVPIRALVEAPFWYSLGATDGK